VFAEARVGEAALKGICEEFVKNNVA